MGTYYSFMRVKSEFLNAGKLGNLLRGLVQASNPYMISLYQTLQNRQESCRYAEPRPKLRERPTHRTKHGNIHTVNLSIGSSVPVDPPQADGLLVLEELEAFMKAL